MQKQQQKQKQQQFTKKQDDRMMQMYQEDQQAIEQYRQPGAKSFQVSSKKSLARNYRDYEIYKAVTPQANAYRQYQKAADYVLQMDHIVQDHGTKEELLIDGDQLKIKDALIHLCSSTLLEKTLSAEQLMNLSEHLYAGRVCTLEQNEEDPNAARYLEMHTEGKKCLADIYIRHLDAVDRKYGDKLAAMTPTQYLKALPQLEDDLSVIADMKIFFENEQLEDLPAQQQILMKNKLDYYDRTYQVLRDRQQTYVDILSERLDEKGNLKKDSSQDYSSQLQTLKKDAKRLKAFERMKLSGRKETDFFEQTKLRKQKAFELGVQFSEEEMNRKATNEEKNQELMDVKTRYGLYVNKYLEPMRHLNSKRPEKSGKEQTDWDIKAKNMKVLLNNYMKDENRIKDEQEAEEVRQHMETLERETSVDGMRDLTDDEIEPFVDRMETNLRKLYEFNRFTTDDAFVEQFGMHIRLHENTIYDMSAFDNIYRDKYRKLLKKHADGQLELDPETVQKYQRLDEKLHELHNLAREYQNAGHGMGNNANWMRTRLKEIERYGVSHDARIDRREYNWMTAAQTVTEAYREDLKKSEQPMSFEQASMYGLEEGEKRIVLADPFNSAVPMEQRLKKWPQIFELARACKKLEEMKNTSPDYYRLGQPYNRYRNCERLLQIKPYVDRLISLLLRMSHLDAMGNLQEDRIDFQNLKQEFDAVKDIYNDFSASRNRVSWQDNLQYSLGAGVMLHEQKCRFLAECSKKSADDKTGDGENQEYSPEQLAFLGLPAKRVQFINHMRSLGRDYDNPGAQADLMKRYDMQTATEEEKRTARQQMAEIALLEKGEVTDQSEQAMKSCLLRFEGAYRTVLDELEMENYRDSALVELEPELEQCKLMSDFLVLSMNRKGVTDGLKKRWWSQPQDALNLQWLDQVAEQRSQLEELLYTARNLSFQHLGQLKDKVGAVSYLEDGNTVQLSEDNVKKFTETYQGRAHGSQAFERLRKAKLTQQADPEQLKKTDVYVKVRKAVGQEMMTDAKKAMAKEAKNDPDMFGHIAGKPLQFVNWVLRDKRKYHGAQNYDACKKLFEKKLANIDSVLNDWQRGDEGHSPVIQLRKYYGDLFKTGLRTDIQYVQTHQSEHDFEDENFAKAIEAIDMYAKIEGIVNTDTTEMEMTFLDQFRKSAAMYLENHEAVDRPKVAASRAWLQSMLSDIELKLSGTLDQTMTSEELKTIDKLTVSYVEDTTYSSNLEESNIADIPLFTHTPSLNDVKQSAIGDCWLMSAISSVVNTNPDFIRSMFYDLGDGNVLVRLYETYDEKGQEINWKQDDHCSSTKPRYFKLRKHYETGWGNAADCTWVQLLEKAYALGGFNHQDSVRVSNGRLYNVVDELTCGYAESAIAHLTGQIPDHFQAINTKKLWSDDMVEGFLAGLSKDEEILMLGAFFDMEGHYSQKKETISIEKMYQYMEQNLFFELFHDLWKKKGIVPEDSELTDGLKKQIADHYIHVMRENVERMKNGEKLPFRAQDQKNQKKKETDAFIRDRQKTVKYFETVIGNYSQRESGLIRWVENVIRQSGTVSICIPHYVNIVDVTEFQGNYYFLMRDPFNIYNTEYTQKETRQEGLMEVFTKRNKNRHLKDTRRDIVHGGFRGTSWIEAKELCSKILTAHAVTKKMIDMDND